MQGIVQFTSHNPGMAISFAVAIVSGFVALAWAGVRFHWRELYAAVELVRRNSPVEKKDPTYGHRLVWQGPYYNVEFRLGKDRGAIAFHSDGHERGWRVVGTLWWLGVDEGNPTGFYRRSGDNASRHVPRVIRSVFEELVGVIKKRAPEFVQTA